MDARELLLDEFRACLRAGNDLPRRPRPEELFHLIGDGPGVLLVTLEYLAARREALAEIDVYEDDVEAATCPVGRGIAA